jgi:protein-S-isoprenylcysteine O-methyltransferase Ste14
VRVLIFIGAVSCFASFGWAMLRHFRRAGPPKLGMVLTGLTVPAFAAIHVAGVLTRPLAQPAAALFLYAGSMGLFWSAVLATRQSNLAACFQRHVGSTVVRTGPYHFIRHPFYSAYMLTWAGGFVATGWWAAGVTAAIMAGVYYCAARQEERAFLHSPLRDEYSGFMRETGRFVPFRRSRQ